MIKPGAKIVNVRTGQIMIFLKTGADTNGQLLQIDCISPPSSIREPEHVHPLQENRFEIISGSCYFSVDGREQVLGPGQSIRIPPKVRHHFWNSGETDAHYIQEFRPALDIAGFFEIFFDMAGKGKLNRKGIPNLFHASIISLKYRKEIRLASPPWFIQYFTFLLLTPIAKLLGYRADLENK